MSKLAFAAQTVDIAYLPLRQDFLARNVLMTAKRDFGLGNSLFAFDKSPPHQVSGDPHLLDLGKFEKIRILSPALGRALIASLSSAWFLLQAQILVITN